MAAKTLIGCRLPNGLILHHPEKRSVTVKLAGLNGARIVPTPNYVTTEVDVDFWEAWKKAHADYPPIKSEAIFEAKSGVDAQAKAKELKDEKTGLEPMKQDADGVKAAD